MTSPHAVPDSLSGPRTPRSRPGVRHDASGAALVHVRDRRLHLEIELLLTADEELAVETMRRLLERARHITARDALDVGEERARLDRLLDRDDRGARRVLRDHAGGAELGGLLGLREHPRDGHPVEEDLGARFDDGLGVAVGRGRAWEERLVAPARAGVVLAGHVVDRQHLHDARHLHRGRDVEAIEPRVRVRRHDRPRREHARHARREVIGVERGSGDVVLRALVRDRAAHDPTIVHAAHRSGSSRGAGVVSARRLSSRARAHVGEMMSVARIPFTPDDESAIRTLTGTMLFLLVINFIFGGLGLLGGCLVGFGVVGTMAIHPLAGIGTLIMALAMLLYALGMLGQGALLVQVRRSLDQMLRTDSQDQSLMSDAFAKLRLFFGLEAVLFLVAIMLTFGSALTQAFGAMMPGQLGGGF
ncbi:MAG: hypothetical protein M3Y87_25800 [Myxococcota bacterium]|nr:hypothetical protein [Myxococcota bacterium]